MINNYSTLIKNFETILPEKAEKLINSKTGSVIYIGFDTCPYCNMFLPKLNTVLEKLSIKGYYINSRDIDNMDNIINFRKKYDIRTVPTLLVANNKLFIKSDSSMSEGEILEAIAKNK